MSAPAADYDALRAALARRRESLSPRLGQLARFLLDHPEEAAVGTAARLAAHAGVPAATVTRLAQEMGFAGFPGMQALFRERLLGPPFAERLGALAGAPPGDLTRPETVLTDLTRAAIRSLMRIEAEADRAALAAMVDALADCGAVHVAAARGAFGIGAHALYGLRSIGVRAHLIDNLGAMRAGQVAAMAEGDVLLALSFDDYTPETVQTARAAAEAGRCVLAITDNELSPLAPLAEAVLFVGEARLGHFRSQVPVLVLVQTLVMALGARIGMNEALHSSRHEISLSAGSEEAR